MNLGQAAATRGAVSFINMDSKPVFQTSDWVFPVSGGQFHYVEDGLGNIRASEVPSAAELSECYANSFDRAAYTRATVNSKGGTS